MKSWSVNGIFLLLVLGCLIAINTIAYHVPCGWMRQLTSSTQFQRVPKNIDEIRRPGTC